jgi:hypothetical protein
MLKRLRRLRHVFQLASTLLTLIVGALRYLGLCLHPSSALAAENLFLRKQLALYQERHVKPRSAMNATRIALLRLGRWFDWRPALAMLQPQDLHPLASTSLSSVVAVAISSGPPPRFLWSSEP